MPPSLSRLFDPQSIAIVGASSAPEKPGFQMVRAFEKFPGRVYPVNPRGGRILGFEVHPSLSAIPEPVDLIALLVPPEASADVLREAAECGAGAAFMISGGFSETGEKGRKMQDELLEICRSSGIRLLGPNTSGFMRPSRRLFCTFLAAAADIRRGGIGIVAQSGGINLTAAFLAHERGLGISLAAGIGNGADIDVAETISYLAEDDETRAIAIHLEGVADGAGLVEAIRATAPKKPVIALPVGRSDLGDFAESHTGNLMGTYDLTCAALRQAGAVVVETTTQLIDGAQALSHRRLPAKAEPGVGILTGQAGPGLLMTDRLRSAGVAIPEVGEKTSARIAGMLPPLTYTRNPVDTGRPLESFGGVCAALAADEAIDAMLVYALHEADSVDFADAVGAAADDTGKPFVFATQGRRLDIGPLLRQLEKRDVATVASPDRAADAVRALVEDAQGQWRAGRDRSPPNTPAKPPALPEAPDEAAAKDLLGAWGIATPARVVCTSHEDAHAAMKKLTGEVVVKVLDPEIAHKTEAGGVHVGIASAGAMDTALDAIDAIEGGGKGRRYLVEEMAAPGLEAIVGARNDESWGPVVLLGLGGIAAEAFGDVAMALAPLDREDALALIGGLRASALFDGFRGTPSCDREALADLIATVGELVRCTPAIREIDLNPVRVYPDGVIALDALIVR